MTDLSIKKGNDTERDLLNVDALQTERPPVESSHSELSLRLKDPSIYISKNTEEQDPFTQQLPRAMQAARSAVIASKGLGKEESWRSVDKSGTGNGNIYADESSRPAPQTLSDDSERESIGFSF